MPPLFFFFKQKTAYELRISYWSSDVCSSDLAVGKAWRHLLVEEARPLGCGDRGAAGALGAEVELQACHGKGAVAAGRLGQQRQRRETARQRQREGQKGENQRRSEEHTSELQSLMRISYAVFCLKKKKQPRSK